MTGSVATFILGLPPLVALLVVFALPALESSVFVGFVFPGEIALLLGGVLASQGSLALPAVIGVGVAGAVLGDSVGYAVGRRYGRRLLDGTIGRWVKPDHLDRAESYLARKGGAAVLFGRFTAALRVLVPGVAGMSGLRYRTFLTFNVAGAVGWVILSVLLGYLGGSSWQHAQHLTTLAGLSALAVLAVVFAARPLLRLLRISRRPWGVPPREVLAFLAVGGAGYVVDVAVFNLLRSIAVIGALDPAVAKTLATAAAMCVTYLGNRTWTWRGQVGPDRRREVGLFVVFNVIGFGFSVLALLVSHDLLGWTSRMADNISANVVGMALGTLFRFVTYKRFVFTADAPPLVRDADDVRVG